MKYTTSLATPVKSEKSVTIIAISLSKEQPFRKLDYSSYCETIPEFLWVSLSDIPTERGPMGRYH